MLTFKGLEEYERKLSQIAKDIKKICGRTTYEGAKIIADEIRKGIDGLPERTGVTKRGLQSGFGISKLQNDDGYYNVKLGFDGYNENGVPNQLMARAFESGTSKLQKHPFVRPAINHSKNRAESKMAEVLDDEMKKMMD